MCCACGIRVRTDRHTGLLASFVGAHMPHYRSEVRLRLREEAVPAKG
jgi:hypothetical protein